MCLDISEKITKKVREQLEGGRTVFWKMFIFNWSRTMLLSRFEKHPYHAGWNKSDRYRKAVTRRETSAGEIVRGAHVFLTRSAAMRHARRGRVVVRVTASVADFVAAGKFGQYPTRQNAVFMKVHIDPKDYEKALGATL